MSNPNLKPFETHLYLRPAKKATDFLIRIERKVQQPFYSFNQKHYVDARFYLSLFNPT